MRPLHIVYPVIVAGMLLASSSQALAICRVVNDPSDPPPQIKPDQSVLFLQRTNLEIGDCSDGDAGPEDGGPEDAGADDGGVMDAGADASSLDASSSDGGSSACDVIPEAVTMVVQPKFNVGSVGSSFALLMVTPSAPLISLERKELFTNLAAGTGPEVLVNEVYVEDESLGYQCQDPRFNQEPIACFGGDWAPRGPGFEAPPPPPWDDPQTDSIEQVGPYDVARLTASSSEELGASLTTLGYDYVQEDLDAIAPYLELGYVAIAVRVRIDGELNGGLRPLSLTYPGTEMRLPLGISRSAELAETHIALYVSADARYDFPGATVSYSQRQYDSPDNLVLTRSNLSTLLNSGPEGDPIAVLASSQQPVRDTVTVTQEINIPSSRCPDDNDSGFCGCGQSGKSGTRGVGNGLLLALSLGLGLFVSRRRRRNN